MTNDELIDRLGLQTAEDGDSLSLQDDNGDLSWVNWNDASGRDVQGFIKKRLSEAITSLKYDNTEKKLIGQNSLGENVVEADITIEYPNYAIDSVTIQEVVLAGTNINSDSININGNAIASQTIAGQNHVTFNWNLKNTTSSEDYCKNQVSYKVILLQGEDEFSSISGKATYSESGCTVDIKNLFANINDSGKFSLKVEVSYDFFNGESTTSTSQFSKYVYDISIQIIKLVCSVQNYTTSKQVTFNYNLTDATAFCLEYSINGKNIQTVNSLGSNSQYTLDISNEIGSDLVKTFVIVARLKTKSSTNALMSNWVTSSFIYQDPGAAGNGAKAFITNIPETITNCDSAKVFSITTTNELQGDITVYVYKDDTESAFMKNISTTQGTYYFKNYTPYRTYTLNLTNSDKSDTIDYYIYNELTSGSNNIYLAFVIDYGKSAEIFTTYSFANSYNPGNASPKKYNKIEVVNPTEGVQRYLPVTDNLILNFSQADTSSKFNINGSLMQIFDPSNINKNLDSSCGLLQEDQYTCFKVAPVQGGLFRQNLQIKNSSGEFLAKSTNPFSIEVTLKTYNVTDDDDEIMSIGNIRFYTNYLRLWSSDQGMSNGKLDIASPYIASCANFAKNEITHIVITYDPKYKPTTYEKAYLNNLYPGYSTANPQTPCLKIYINGEINRSISVFTFSNLLRDNAFNLQINPQNSNFNIYSFKTYSKCLSKEEVQKNKIAQLAFYQDKKDFFEANDLTYSQEDYTGDVWAQIQEKGLANTISIRKCLNIQDERYNTLGKSKIFTPKNVMLLVVGDEGPLYYGNKKHLDSASNKEVKPLDAAMFIKYAHTATENSRYESTYNGKFIGKYLSYEHGYDEYYKAQGSSAKRYGGAYNVQFSKFYFIPENKLSIFSQLMRGEYRDPTCTSAFEESDGTYKTKYDMTILNSREEMTKLNLAGTPGETNEALAYENVEGYQFNKVLESPVLGIKTSYQLPTETENQADIVKLVGKVNYASSMQSHKQGACDLYAACYPKKYSNYKESSFNPDGDFMKRRAVKEDVFYYFFIELSKCKNHENGEAPTFRDITWDNIDLDEVKFFGFQTWGSAKMDNDTFGYNKKDSIGYLLVEGADNKNANTNFKSPWAAMQIWNTNSKGELLDESGNKTYFKNDPYYELIARDNKYIHQNAGIKNGTPDYLTGLLYNDETIMAKKPSEQEFDAGDKAIEKGPDAWDIGGALLTEAKDAQEKIVDKAFVVKEFKTYDEASQKFGPKISPAAESLKDFAKFTNYIYLFDFSNLKLFNNTNTNLYNQDPQFKYVCNSSEPVTVQYGTSGNTQSITYQNIQPGDIFRWDQILERFVPAGLYYDTEKNQWNSLNIGTLAEEFQNSFSEARSRDTNTYEYTKLIREALAHCSSDYSKIFATNGDYFPSMELNVQNLISNFGVIANEEDALNSLKLILADAFKCAIYAYCDVDSFTYHQAAIRFLSGTDNRAKNIYFAIKGPTYKESKVYANANNSEVRSTRDDTHTEETKVYSIDDPSKQYNNNNLITLFQDDLDTIFATDNNGQQSKAYNLVEPAYNNNTISNWGDSRSGLWYNFDIVFEPQIKAHLKSIIDHEISSGKIINSTNNLYKEFLSIQDSIIPAVGYNHTSEIYYDVMQLCFKGGKLTSFGENTGKFDKYFNNNLVPNPESLVHGGCLESEREFLKKRIALLASYSGAAFQSEDDDEIGITGNSAGGTENKEIFAFTNTSFIQDFYPSFLGTGIYKVRNYGDVMINKYYEYNTREVNTYLTALASGEDQFDFNVELSAGLTAADALKHTDFIKTITFRSGVSNLSKIYLKNAKEIKYKEPDYTEGSDKLLDVQKGINFIIPSDSSDVIDLSKISPNVEILEVPYSKFEKTIIDLQKCTRIQKLDLSNATNSLSQTNFDNVLLPKSNSLQQCILPSGTQSLTINYYPNITSIDNIGFDSSSTNLSSLVIDWRNTWTEEFIKKYFNITANSTLVLTGVSSEITLSKFMLNVLTSVKNFSFVNKIKINLDESSGERMDFLLKKNLVETFGDIDNTNNDVYIVYSKAGKEVRSIQMPVDITLAQGVGTVPYKLVASDGSDAVAVAIAGHRLNVSYAIRNVKKAENSGSSSITVDLDGNITIPNDIKDTSSFDFVVTCGTISATCHVYVGFYTPVCGDFANYDGTFSPIYNPETAIGVVYYVADSKPTSATVSVMSLAPIIQNPRYNDLIFRYGDNLSQAPASYRVAHDVTSNGGYDLEITVDTSSVSTFGTTPINDFTADIIPRSSTEIMNKHLDAAIGNYKKLKSQASDISKTDKKKLLEIIDEVATSGQFAVGQYTASGVEMLPFVYPAYLRVAAFTPEKVVDPESPYLKTWEIPDTQTVAYLIQQVIKSSQNRIDNSNNKNAELWNASTGWSNDTNTLFGRVNANNGNCNMIGWLGKSVKVTCEPGMGYSYYQNAANSRTYTNKAYHDYTYTTTTYYGFEYNTYTYGGTDLSYPTSSSQIYPCITFSISKK